MSRTTLRGMAKALSGCPFCGSDKVTDDGGKYSNHVDPGDGSLCTLSGHTIQGREDDGPVTDGQGRAQL